MARRRCSPWLPIGWVRDVPEVTWCAECRGWARACGGCGQAFRHDHPTQEPQEPLKSPLPEDELRVAALRDTVQGLRRLEGILGGFVSGWIVQDLRAHRERLERMISTDALNVLEREIVSYLDGPGSMEGGALHAELRGVRRLLAERRAGVNTAVDTLTGRCP